ncbi:MAG: hypothetical protein P4M14_09045 [Gammaproteobacteria bacterium]|nr:hypothetical protein [Gammaproteobacteria bacterium]
MSPETQVQIGKFKANPKQLATIGIMIVVVLIIIWQVMGMFGGGSSSAPAPTPAAPVTKMNSAAAAAPAPAATTTTTTTTTNNNANPVPQGSQADAVAPSNGRPSQAAVQTNAELLKLQQKTEESYLKAINELQMLKVQQAIAETNQAIATAKLSTVTSEKNIADMLTKPSPSEASYANNLTAPTMSSEPLPGLPPVAGAASAGSATAAAAAAQARAAMASVVPDAPYLVLSVSQQGGKWTAVMGLSGKLFTVSVGDSLPDQSSVVGINREGVTLEKDKKIRKVAMASMI